MKTLMMIVAMVGVFGLAGSVQAVESNWTGGGDGSTWTLGTNWDNGAPSPHINGGDTYNVLLAGASPSYAGQAEVGNSGAGTATLNINTTGTLTFDGLVVGRNAAGQVTQTTGTVNVSTSSAENGLTMAVGGPVVSRYDMDGGSLINDGFFYSGYNANSTAIIEQTGGTVVLGDGVPRPGTPDRGDFLILAAHTDSTARYEISGGSLVVNTGTTAGGSTQGAAIYIGTGAWPWSGGEANDGGAGTFKVVGSVAGGGPTSVAWTTDTVFIRGTGTYKGELAFTMDSLGVTPIDLTGALSLLDSPLLTLDMSGLGGGVGNIPLVNNDGADAIVGTFSGLAEGAPVGGYTLTYIGGDGNDLVLLAPIPEPAGLGLIGLALLAVRRRRS